MLQGTLDVASDAEPAKVPIDAAAIDIPVVTFEIRFAFGRLVVRVFSSDSRSLICF